MQLFLLSPHGLLPPMLSLWGTEAPVCPQSALWGYCHPAGVFLTPDLREKEGTNKSSSSPDF